MSVVTAETTRPEPPESKVSVAPPSVAQLDLAAFLQSINAEVSLSTQSSGNERSYTSASPPSLPISARVALLEAQISTVSDLTAKAIRADLPKFRSQAEALTGMRSEMDKLNDDVGSLEVRLTGSAGEQLLSSSLVSSLNEYHTALSTEVYETTLLEGMLSLRQSTSALTALESTLRHGSLDQQTFDPALEAAREAYSHLEKNAVSFSSVPQPASLAKLAYVRAIGSRLGEVTKKRDVMLEEAWGQAIQMQVVMEPSFGLKQGSLQIQTSIKLTTESPSSLDLPTMFGILEKNAALPPLLRNLADELLGRICRHFLAESASQARWLVMQSVDAEQRRWSVERASAADDDPWGENEAPSPSSAPTVSGIEALSSLLLFMSAELFSDRPVPRIYSNALLPHLLPLVIEHLNISLPSTLSPLSVSLGTVHELCAQARDLHAVFVRAKLATESDSDDDDLAPATLLRWAASGTAHLTRCVSNAHRNTARRIIQDDDQSGSQTGLGGWSGQVVEMDAELDMPSMPALLGAETQTNSSQANAQIVGQAKLSSLSKEVRQSSSSSSNTASSQEDDDFVDAILGTASPLRRAESAENLVVAPTSETPPARKVRGRAALGAARVIRPQDQMGSGPWDEADARSTASASGQSFMAPQVEAGDDDDDDAWGLSKEEIEVRAAKRASRMWESAPTVVIPPPVSAAEDEDVAWDLDDEPNGGSSLAIQPSHEVLAHLAPAQEDEEEDPDDAWGLSSEEVQARADMQVTADSRVESSAAPEDEVAWDFDAPADPTSLPTQSASAPTHPPAQLLAHLAPQLEGDDDDDDAWGLSEQQLEDRAAKRASRLLDASTVAAAAPAPVHLPASSALLEQDEDDAWGIADNDNTGQSSSTSVRADDSVRQSSIASDHPIDNSNESQTLPISEGTLQESSLIPSTADADDECDLDQMPSDSDELGGKEALHALPPAASIEGMVDSSSIGERTAEVTDEEVQVADSAVYQELASVDDEGRDEAPSIQPVIPTTEELPPTLDRVTETGVMQWSALPDTAEEAEVDSSNSNDKAVYAPTRGTLGPEPHLLMVSDPQPTESVEKDQSAGIDPGVTDVSTSDTVSNEHLDGIKSGHNVPDASLLGTAAEPAHSDNAAASLVDDGDNENRPDLEEVSLPSALVEPPASLPGVAPGDHADHSHIISAEDQSGDAWGWQDDAEEDTQPSSVGLSSSSRSNGVRTVTATSSSTFQQHLSPKPTPASVRSAAPSASPASATGGSQSRPSSRTSDSRLSGHVAPTVRKEKCTISTRSVRLVELAQKIIDDAVELSRADSVTYTFAAPDPYALLDTLVDTLDLYRALMPIAHADVLASVPALSMQFANDCSYIARELLRLAKSRQDVVFPPRREPAKDTSRSISVDEDGHLCLTEQARMTTALGRRCFEAQLNSQIRVLLEILDGAEGFEATYDDARLASCQRAMKQVIHTLTQLSTVWKAPLLAPWTYMTALGRLVETVLQRVIADIIALEDISEVESEKLGDLCKSLKPLEDLFEDPVSKQSAVALVVPSWFKASYLNDILIGSLVDIDYLLTEAGALVDFSPRELSKLVRALFADTAKRSQLLEKIDRLVA